LNLGFQLGKVASASLSPELCFFMIEDARENHNRVSPYSSVR